MNVMLILIGLASYFGPVGCWFSWFVDVYLCSWFIIEFTFGSTLVSSAILFHIHPVCESPTYISFVLFWFRVHHMTIHPKPLGVLFWIWLRECLYCVCALVSKGQYSGQKSSFLPQPQKPGKTWTCLHPVFTQSCGGRSWKMVFCWRHFTVPTGALPLEPLDAKNWLKIKLIQLLLGWYPGVVNSLLEVYCNVEFSTMNTDFKWKFFKDSKISGFATFRYYT